VVHALILFLSYAFYYILLLLLIFIIKRSRIINSSAQTYLGLLWYSWKENEVDSVFLLVQICIRSANTRGVSGAPVAGGRTSREDRSDRQVLYAVRSDRPLSVVRSPGASEPIQSLGQPYLLLLSSYPFICTPTKNTSRLFLSQGEKDPPCGEALPFDPGPTEGIPDLTATSSTISFGYFIDSSPLTHGFRSLGFNVSSIRIHFWAMDLLDCWLE
jgi:hypothetical protein